MPNLRVTLTFLEPGQMDLRGTKALAASLTSWPWGRFGNRSQRT